MMTVQSQKALKSSQMGSPFGCDFESESEILTKEGSGGAARKRGSTAGGIEIL